MSKCDVYYFSDMEKCITCGMIWDANDPYPPKCLIEMPKEVSFIDKLIAYVFGSKR